MPDPAFDPAAARDAILARIAQAAREAGRDPADITLTAVSKQQSRQAVSAILGCGQRVFGENRVQEAIERWGGRRSGLELRLIGPLQTNKVRLAISFFDAIETLDRVRLAEEIAREVQHSGRCPKLLVQVNTGEEPQKSGLAPHEVDVFLARVRGDHGLEIAGLMCLPPVGEPAAPHFALLAKIARRNGLSELSMGMSDDFETAVRLGATHLRIGTALFGPRLTPRQKLSIEGG
ncbi:MAG: YggS family pyridoxal phosphate-dependent enzyme [Caulobacteraceae bacterium]